jgi:hypothetical protein
MLTCLKLSLTKALTKNKRLKNMKALMPKGTLIHLIFKVLKPKIKGDLVTLITLDTERLLNKLTLSRLLCYKME